MRLTAKQEKKPQSTFQTLKQSLKLSNNKKLKQDSTQHSNDTNKSVKAKKMARPRRKPEHKGKEYQLRDFHCLPMAMFRL